MWKIVMAALILLVAGMALAKEPRGPIRILSDFDFTPENGVVAGSGTPDDPFVIAGWVIQAGDAAFGIQIRGVSRPFVIEDVEVNGGRVAALCIETTKNARISSLLIRGAPTGILISLSRDVWVENVRVLGCEDAVRLLFSHDIRLSSLWVEGARVGFWFAGTTGAELRDSYISADLGALLELGSSGNLFLGNGFFCDTAVESEGGNVWSEGGRGNYWDGFHAPDADGDGILDLPYAVSPAEVDHFPLARFLPEGGSGP